MRVILKSEVDNLGRFGDQVKVAPGYARNFLIPKGLAVEATPGNLRQFEAEKEAWLKKEAVRKQKSEDAKAQLDAVTLTFTRKAAEDGKLFGSVTSHDISEALKAKGYTFEKKDIRLEEPIKALGESTVEIKLHSEVKAAVKVSVAKEE